MERCPKIRKNGKPCFYPAGLGTNHEGYGSCNRHGGAWPQSERIWSQAMEIAGKEEISPPEALLSLVQTAMGRVRYTDLLLSEQMKAHIQKGGDPLKPPGIIREWMRTSREERKLAEITAKDAVNAGVMAVLARRMDVEGSLVADAVTAALDSLGLTAEDRMKALGAAQQRLLDAE